MDGDSSDDANCNTYIYTENQAYLHTESGAGMPFCV